VARDFGLNGSLAPPARGRTLCRLTRTAANFENLIVLLQFSVSDDMLDKRLRIAWPRRLIHISHLIECKALFHIALVKKERARTKNGGQGDVA